MDAKMMKIANHFNEGIYTAILKISIDCNLNKTILILK